MRLTNRISVLCLAVIGIATDPRLGGKFMEEFDTWELLNFTSLSGLNAANYATVSYKYTFQRKASYYIFVIVLPCTALMALQFGAFALPPANVDRSAFSMTVVLAFYIVQTIVDGMVPNMSRPLLIEIFIICQMVIGVVITIYFCVSCHFASLESAQKSKTSTIKNSSIKSSTARKVDTLIFVIMLVTTLGLYAGIFIAMMNA